MPSPLTERRLEEREARRDAIIGAAEQAFAAKGIDAATMGDVAARARLSRALLYTYFEDKEDLLMAVAHRGQSELLERFERAAARPGTGLDRIETIGHTFVELAHERPVHFEALMRFEGREVVPDEAESALRDAMHQMRRIIDVLAGLVEAGVADGSVRPDVGPPHEVAVTLWGFVYGAVQLGTFKGTMLQALHGFGPDALVGRSLDLIGRALAAPR